MVVLKNFYLILFKILFIFSLAIVIIPSTNVLAENNSCSRPLTPEEKAKLETTKQELNKRDENRNKYPAVIKNHTIIVKMSDDLHLNIKETFDFNIKDSTKDYVFNYKLPSKLKTKFKDNLEIFYDTNLTINKDSTPHSSQNHSDHALLTFHQKDFKNNQVEINYSLQAKFNHAIKNPELIFPLSQILENTETITTNFFFYSNPTINTPPYFYLGDKLINLTNGTEDIEHDTTNYRASTEFHDNLFISLRSDLVSGILNTGINKTTHAIFINLPIKSSLIKKTTHNQLTHNTIYKYLLTILISFLVLLTFIKIIFLNITQNRIKQRTRNERR